MIEINFRNMSQIEKNIKFNKLNYNDFLDYFLSIENINSLKEEIKLFNKLIAEKRAVKQKIKKELNDNSVLKINQIFCKYPNLFDDIIFLFIKNDLKINFINFVYDYIKEKKNILFINSILNHIKKDYFGSNKIEREGIYNKFKILNVEIKKSLSEYQNSPIENLKNDFNFHEEKLKNINMEDNIFLFSDFLITHPCIPFDKYFEELKEYDQDSLINIEYSFSFDQIVKISEYIKFETLIYKYSYLILLKNEYILKIDNAKEDLIQTIKYNISKLHKFTPAEYIIEIMVNSIILFLKGKHLNIFDLLPIIEKFYKITYEKKDDFDFKSLIVENETLYNNKYLRHIYLRNSSIKNNIENKISSINIKNNFFHNKIHEEYFLEALSMFVYEFIYISYIKK